MEKNYQLIKLESELKQLDTIIRYSKLDNELIKLRIEKKKLLLKKYELLNKK